MSNRVVHAVALWKYINVCYFFVVITGTCFIYKVKLIVIYI